MYYEKIKILCQYCKSDDIKRNGKKANGKQNYYCKTCHKQFQIDYTYNGCKTQVKKQIIDMTARASGIRDIAYVLKVSPTTVIKTIRDYARTIHEPEPKGNETIQAVEIDEQWSFVESKTNQQWLWYVFDRETKKILAFYIGKRTDQSCQALLLKLSPVNISVFYTDNWDSYSKFIPQDRHIISKAQTQNIERSNLNFRTHIKRLARKTICYSKSEDMHYSVIKIYIHYLNSGLFLNSIQSVT